MTLARPVGTHRVQPWWSSACVWCAFVFVRCSGSCTRVCALVTRKCEFCVQQWCRWVLGYARVSFERCQTLITYDMGCFRQLSSNARIRRKMLVS